MAVTLKQMPCDFCVPECLYYDAIVSRDVFYGDFERQAVITTLSCQHELICKMWYNIIKEDK